MSVGWSAVAGTIVSMAASYYQMYMQQQASKRNIKNIKETLALRGKERTASLARMLGSQHLAFVSQGTDPGSVSAQVVGRETIEATIAEGKLDAAETVVGIQNERARAASATVEAVARIGQSAFSYADYRSRTALTDSSSTATARKRK